MSSCTVNTHYRTRLPKLEFTEEAAYLAATPGSVCAASNSGTSEDSDTTSLPDPLGGLVAQVQVVEHNPGNSRAMPVMVNVACMGLHNGLSEAESGPNHDNKRNDPTTLPSRGHSQPVVKPPPPAPIDFCEDDAPLNSSFEKLSSAAVPLTTRSSSKLMWLASPFYPSYHPHARGGNTPATSSPTTGLEHIYPSSCMTSPAGISVETPSTAQGQKHSNVAQSSYAPMQYTSCGVTRWYSDSALYCSPNSQSSPAAVIDEACSPTHSQESCPGQETSSCLSLHPQPLSQQATASTQPPPLSVDYEEENTSLYYDSGANQPVGIAVPETICLVEYIEDLEAVCGAILAAANARCALRQTHGFVPDMDHWDPLSDAMIAVDLEGRNLGRSGSICIITMATPEAVYIVDMVKLGREALQVGSALRQVLESPSICKLMFDCRSDCEALFFLYSVRLRHVCDLQVSSCYALQPYSPMLPSMKEVFCTLHLLTLAETEVKVRGKDYFDPRTGGSFRHWEARPLAPLLLEYCAVDVKHLFEASYLLRDHVEEGYKVGETRVVDVCGGQCVKRNAMRDF